MEKFGKIMTAELEIELEYRMMSCVSLGPLMAIATYQILHRGAVITTKSVYFRPEPPDGGGIILRLAA
jgi:hypothetical protein